MLAAVTILHQPAVAIGCLDTDIGQQTSLSTAHPIKNMRMLMASCVPAGKLMDFRAQWQKSNDVYSGLHMCTSQPQYT